MNLRIWRMFTIYQQGKNWQDLVLDSRAAIGAEVSCRHIPGLASRRRRKRSRSCCDSHSHLFREPLNGLHNDSTRLQNQSGRSAIKVKMICQTFHTISTSGVKRYEHTIFCFVDVMAWPTVVWWPPCLSVSAKLNLPFQPIQRPHHQIQVLHKPSRTQHNDVHFYKNVRASGIQQSFSFGVQWIQMQI